MNRMAKEFKKLTDQLVKLKADLSEESKKALIEESNEIVKQAKKLTPVISGLARNSWFTNKIQRTGLGWKKEVGNGADYASYIEFGFRSHFVPGKWNGDKFIYDPNAKSGMYVGEKGKYVRGRYMLKKATQKSEQRIYDYLKKRIEQLGRDMK